MEISHQIKIYLRTLGALALIVYCLYSGSHDKFDCDDWANVYKAKQFNMVLSKKEEHYGREVYFYGTDLVSGKLAEFEEGGGWLSLNFDKFIIGDTLIKQKGYYTTVIKRNGKTIFIKMNCGKKIYPDK